MKFIVGLGNPGQKYRFTRHNVGFMAVDELATLDGVHESDFKLSKKGQLEYLWLKKNSEQIELVKPQTFMNKAGLALAYLKKKHPQLSGENLFVVYDDLDLKIGSFKLQFGTGPKQHHGLLSIYQHLGTDQFWHVRIGIDGRNGDRSISADKYVLSSFHPDESKIMQTVIAQVIIKLEQRMRTHASHS